MSILSTHKTNFSSGEVSLDVLGRTDLTAYENGALTLKNVFIDPIGGISRRAGLRYIATTDGAIRLIPFSFNTSQTYLLVLSDYTMDVYKNEEKTATLATPWSASEIPFLSWTQSADTLLVVHPDIAPCKITRTSDVSWSISLWSYEMSEDKTSLLMPFESFHDGTILMTPTGTTGDIQLNTSSAYFKPEHQGVRFRLNNGEAEITTVVSDVQVLANVKKKLDDTTASTTFTEQAFSPARGYPTSVTFYQGRLVLGGSRDLPNKLWFSKTFRIMNFDTGTGLDDEAISFSLLSNQVNAIRSVVSGRHLQVFTSGSEWMVSGDPLTPQNIQLKQQTKIGSPLYRTILPLDVSGATIFISADGREIREFLFEDLEKAYQAKNMSLLSAHLIKKPIDLTYDAGRRLIYFVMEDGSMATLTNYRSEEVMAWSHQQTAGEFKAVTTVSDNVYVLVKRGTHTFLETFDDTLNTDCAFLGEESEKCTTWYGMAPLMGKIVKIKADDTILQDREITGNSIQLDEGCYRIEVGLGYTHTIIPLPPADSASANAPLKAVRLVEVRFRVINTLSLRVDTGNGFLEHVLPIISSSYILDKPQQPKNQDICVHALGWCRSGMTPLWQIESDTPSACKIVSITTKMKVSN